MFLKLDYQLDKIVTLPIIQRSFVPPVRDEESETQRKAHAKRVRETRRSTQGVTLEDLKSAEQLVKRKQQQVIQKIKIIHWKNGTCKQLYNQGKSTTNL